MELLTVKELSERIKVSPATIYRLMQKGLPVVKVQNSTRFIIEEVVDWLKEQNN